MDNVYIIVDGLDECRREEQKMIIEFFIDLISSQKNSPGANLRCLFVSQDDVVPHKLLSKLPTIKIEPDDNKSDIQIFANHRTKEVQSKFQLSEKIQQHISDEVQKNARGEILLEFEKFAELIQGVFLLAKLVLNNLLFQPSRDSLVKELYTRNIPTELEQV